MCNTHQYCTHRLRAHPSPPEGPRCPHTTAPQEGVTHWGNGRASVLGWELWAWSSSALGWEIAAVSLGTGGEVKPEGCQASLVAPSSRKHKASSSTLTFVSHGAIGTAQAVSTEQRFSCFLVPSGAVLLPGSSRSVPQVRCHAAGHDTRPSPVCSPGLALGFPHPSHQLSPRALARA